LKREPGGSPHGGFGIGGPVNFQTTNVRHFLAQTIQMRKAPGYSKSIHGKSGGGDRVEVCLHKKDNAFRQSDGPVRKHSCPDKKWRFAGMPPGGAEAAHCIQEYRR
jgi:hypothetical protein